MFRCFHLLSDEPYVIQVAIVTGFHLFPFRTEKLSPSAPMVLHTRGRVGSRRFYERGANSSNACPLLFSFSESLESLESLERLEELEGPQHLFSSLLHQTSTRAAVSLVVMRSRPEMPVTEKTIVSSSIE